MSADFPNLSAQERLRTRPDAAPVMKQTWRSLLFLHWRFPAELVQQRLPPGLTVETWDGSAWIGIVPFEMRHIRPVGLTAVPWLSNFLELNVRTYVRSADGTPGVWFFSLSANRWIAVTAARACFWLPYFWSQMSFFKSANGMRNYHCRRYSSSPSQAARYAYSAVGDLTEAGRGSLEFFLLERYLLFARSRRGDLATGRVFHQPYRFQPVELSRWDGIPFQLDGLPVPTRPPDHAVWSPGVSVEVFGLEPVAGALDNVPSNRYDSSEFPR